MQCPLAQGGKLLMDDSSAHRVLNSICIQGGIALKGLFPANSAQMCLLL